MMAISRLLRHVPSNAFEIATGRLIHISIEERSDGSSLLSLAVPAICADGASLKTIVRNLAQAYATTEIPAEEVVQYADAAEYFNDVLASEFGALGRQYWHPRTIAANRTRLRSLPATADQTGFRPSVVRTRIAASALEQVCSASDHPNISAESFLLTCWQVLLCRIEAREHLVIGCAANGRIASEFENSVGIFETYIPVEMASTS